MPSPELFIARALGVTKRMSFGTGVSLLGFHNPAHIAHRIAQLDHMARGRLYLGIGAGGSAMDAEMFDIDLEEGSPRERMAECVEIILKIWNGEPFDHEGRFYTTRLSPPQPERRLGFHMRPYQDPHPPIAVAGSSPYSSTLEMVGQNGWIPMSSSFLLEKYLPSHREVFERGAKMGGKEAPDDWRISREVFVAEDGDKAREDALNGPFANFFRDYWIPLFGGGPMGLSRLKIDPDMPDEDLTPEYMLENFWIVGDPEECAHRIKKHTRRRGRVRDAAPHVPRLDSRQAEVVPLSGVDGGGGASGGEQGDYGLSLPGHVQSQGRRTAHRTRDWGRDVSLVVCVDRSDTRLATWPVRRCVISARARVGIWRLPPARKGHVRRPGRNTRTLLAGQRRSRTSEPGSWITFSNRLRSPDVRYRHLAREHTQLNSRFICLRSR